MVTFENDSDEENCHSANMIQVVLDGMDDNMEEVGRRHEAHPIVLHHFALADSAVSLEADGFPNNRNPVILGGACAHLMFNHPGTLSTLVFKLTDMPNLLTTQKFLSGDLVQ